MDNWLKDEDKLLKLQLAKHRLMDKHLKWWAKSNKQMANTS